MCRLSILPSNASALAIFVARLLLFISPLVVVAGLFEWQLYRMGESISIRSYVRRYGDCADVPLLLKRRYFSQAFNLYHVAMMKYRKPSLVAIGSSRMSALRSRMFYPLHGGFYTAPNFIYCMEDIEAYAGLISSGYLSKPRAVIIGLDPWWLNVCEERKVWISRDMSDDVYSFSAHISVFRRYMKGLVSGKAVLRGPPKEHYAVSDMNPSVDTPIVAFSYTNYVDRENPPVISRIRSHKNQFTGFKELDPAKLAILYRVIGQFREMGVEVGVIQPPFSNEIVRLLDGNPVKYSWWKPYRDWLPGELEKRGIPCVRASSPAEYGLYDAPHMYDGFHADSSYMTFLVEELIRQSPTGSVLSAVSLEHLRGLRALPKGEPAVFFNIPGSQEVTNAAMNVSIQ